MRSLAILPVLLLCCAPLRAADGAKMQDLPPGTQIESDPKYPPVVTYTLKNGLKLLILEKKFVPTASFAMAFRVGNVDCPSGKTGLAHVFEHMAFKGTKTMNTSDYGKEKAVLARIEETAKALIAEESRAAADPAKVKELREKLSSLEKEAGKYIVDAEFAGTYDRLGSSEMNAYTYVDETVYQVSLPASRLEAWMIMESDRFKNPVLREFYKERSVIMEERRRSEANPGQVAMENLYASAFKAHPYRNPTLGWMDDLKKLTRTDAENFYATFYVPNNATLAIVGDVRPAEVIRLAEKYFGDWKPHALPQTEYTVEPEQKAEKRMTVFFDTKPRLYMGFHNPGENHPDMPALIMLAEVLSNGKTGRFYRNLVEGKQLVLGAGANASGMMSRYPSLFTIVAFPKAPHTSAEAEAAVWQEIDALKTAPPTAWEMEKVLNNYEADVVRSLEGSLDLATSLSRGDRISGDWKYNWKLLEQLKALKPEDISAAARKYLTRGNYTEVELAQPEAAKAVEKK